MPEVLRLFLDRTDTPIGRLMVVADGEGRLRAVDWTDDELHLRHLQMVEHDWPVIGRPVAQPKRHPGVGHRTQRHLRQFLAPQRARRAMEEGLVEPPYAAEACGEGSGLGAAAKAGPEARFLRRRRRSEEAAVLELRRSRGADRPAVDAGRGHADE